MDQDLLRATLEPPLTAIEDSNPGPFLHTALFSNR